MSTGSAPRRLASSAARSPSSSQKPSSTLRDFPSGRLCRSRGNAASRSAPSRPPSRGLMTPVSRQVDPALVFRAYRPVLPRFGPTLRGRCDRRAQQSRVVQVNCVNDNGTNGRHGEVMTSSWPNGNLSCSRPRFLSRLRCRLGQLSPPLRLLLLRIPPAATSAPTPARHRQRTSPRSAPRRLSAGRSSRPAAAPPRRWWFSSGRATPGRLAAPSGARP